MAISGIIGRNRYMVLAVKYVVMAVMSHNSGDWYLPNIIILMTLSGLPISNRGWTAPMSRTTNVMISAILVTGLRHSALDSRRMAEIRVPA